MHRPTITLLKVQYINWLYCIFRSIFLHLEPSIRLRNFLSNTFIPLLALIYKFHYNREQMLIFVYTVLLPMNFSWLKDAFQSNIMTSWLTSYLLTMPLDSQLQILSFSRYTYTNLRVRAYIPKHLPTYFIGILLIVVNYLLIPKMHLIITTRQLRAGRKLSRLFVVGLLCFSNVIVLKSTVS